MATRMAGFAAPILPASPKVDDWEYFHRQFTNYLVIVDATAAQRLPLFLNCLGRDGLLLYNGLPEPKTTYEETVERFAHYFTGRTSILLRRKQFYEARQGHQESASSFAVRLRRLSQECDFGVNVSTLMRDIFVVGIKDDRLGERLLAENATDLTFDLALTKAEAFERARMERGAMAHTEANFIARESRTSHGRRRPAPVGEQTSKSFACFRCGSSDHKANDPRCLAQKKKCLACGKVGHVKSCCRSSKVASNQVHNVETHLEDLTAGEKFDLFACDSLEVNTGSDCFLPVNLSELTREIIVNGTQISALIDTGSQLNVLPRSAVPGLAVTKSQAKIVAWGGFPITVVGEVILEVHYKSKQTKAKFHVVDSLELHHRGVRPLMSYSLCRELGMIDELVNDKEFSISASDTVNLDKSSDLHRSELAVFSENKDLFTGMGTLHTGDRYTITLKDDVQSYSPPARRLPPAVIPKVKQELARLEAAGVIRPIDEPTPFCSPMVVAYRKSGDIRIVTDFRQLNKSVRREEFQIPTIDELAYRARNATVFSKCDLRSGFWQVPIDRKSEKFLAFSTPLGRYTYCKLPMGLSASPEFFSKVLNKVLEGLDSVLIYVDDIVICTASVEEHNTVLQQVLQRLRNAGLTLNPEKCQFYRSEIEFMGHIWSANGISNSHEKLAALRTMTPPRDKQSLRSFLGLATYLGQGYVGHFSSLAKALWDMLAEKELLWDAARLKSFYTIRDLLCSEVTLPFFDPGKPIVVQTDASPQGLGAVILQDNTPTVFVSRTLTDTESRYSQIEREFLAIVFGLSRLKKYLIGTNFTVETDHKPIVQLFSKPIDSLSNRLQRWMVAIQHFSFTIRHIKGSDNILADALSRNSVSGEPIESETAEYTLCFLLQSSPLNLKVIAEATEADPVLSKVKEAITCDWRSQEFKSLKPYYSIREQLTVKQTKDVFVLCNGSRVVVPDSMRSSILQMVHETHTGITKMKAMLRGYCYWPGMNSDIEEFVRRCIPCTVYQKRPDTAPMMPTAERETVPWQSIAVDLTGPSEVLDGKVVLTVIDLFSRYPECFVLRDGSASEIVSCLRSLFARQGFPARVISDNGTQFTSAEFTDFLKGCGVKVVHSSLYYPQGNSTIERLHGSIKSKLRRMRYESSVPLQQALDNILYTMRSSPNDVNGFTPFFRLYGREMSTRLSKLNVMDESKMLTCRPRNVAREYEKKWSIIKSYLPGEKVLVRKQNKQPYLFQGVVIGKVGDFTYEIELGGKRCRYNQSHLKPAKGDIDKDTEWAEQAYDEAAVPEIITSGVSETQQANHPIETRRSGRIKRQPQWFIHEKH